MTDARRQIQCLHSRPCEEKITVFMGKAQTVAWQMAELGNKGHMTLSTPRTCASCISCPQQPVITWAKPLNYWEWTYTYLESTARWRKGIRPSQITQTSSSITLLITRLQGYHKQIEYYHSPFTKAKPKIVSSNVSNLPHHLASLIPSSSLWPSYRVCFPLLELRRI